MVGHICKHKIKMRIHFSSVQHLQTRKMAKGWWWIVCITIWLHSCNRWNIRGRINGMSKLISNPNVQTVGKLCLWHEAICTKTGEEQFKSHPKDNPLAGYVEIVLALSQSFPMLIDFQNVHNIHSLAIAATFEALINELKRRNDSQLLSFSKCFPLRK